MVLENTQKVDIGQLRKVDTSGTLWHYDLHKELILVLGPVKPKSADGYWTCMRLAGGKDLVLPTGWIELHTEVIASAGGPDALPQNV